MELNSFFQTHEDPNREKLMKMTKEDLITLTQNAYFLGSDVFNFICKSVSNDVLPSDIAEVEP
jgi:hypothetical protein